MSEELERLLLTVAEPARSSMEEEIRGFRELFDKFISEPGPSVEWENIQELPPHSILSHSSLTADFSTLS